MSERFRERLGNAILGIDTLWGGDVMCASGTGRFIADSWFSDGPLPLADTAALAAKLREWGGVPGRGVGRAAVAGERGVVASTAKAPEPSQPKAKGERVAELLVRAGYKSADRDGLLQAVDAWRRERTVPMGSVKAMGAAVIAQFDQLSVEHLLPLLPKELAG